MEWHFLYRLLDLIRDREEKINLARFAYVLARLEPKREGEKESIGNFQKNQWSNNEKDSKQLITAIYVYVYLNRKEDKDYDTE